MVPKFQSKNEQYLYDQFPMIADKFFYWKLRKAQPI